MGYVATAGQLYNDIHGGAPTYFEQETHTIAKIEIDSRTVASVGRMICMLVRVGNGKHQNAYTGGGDWKRS